MVIHPFAQFSMPMSKNKEDLTQTQIHGENIIVILPYAKYGVAILKDKKGCGSNKKQCETRGTWATSLT